MGQNTNEAKICHITSVHNAFDTRIFYKECKSLRKHFQNVLLIAPDNNNEEAEGIKIVALPQFKNRFLRFAITDPVGFMKALRSGAHLYHFHDPELMPWMVLLKLTTKAKVIYDVHDNYFTSIREKTWIKGIFTRAILATLFNHFELTFAKSFDALIIAQENFEGKFEKSSIRRITTVLNYPMQSFHEPSSPVKFIREPAFTYLVYSGSVSEARGIWNYLEIIKMLREKRRDIKLFLIGKFVSDTLYESVINFIEKNSLKDYIKIIGGREYVKRDVIDQYLLQMDIGIYIVPYSPHFEQAYPTKFFDYMVAGIPIVASELTTWKQFLDKNECGITANPYDLSEICDKIIYLTENESARKKMGENGKRAVKEEYNWEKEEAKLIALYKELLQ